MNLLWLDACDSGGCCCFVSGFKRPDSSSCSFWSGPGEEGQPAALDAAMKCDVERRGGSAHLAHRRSKYQTPVLQLKRLRPHSLVPTKSRQIGRGKKGEC